MLISIYKNEILTGLVKLFFSILSVNFNHLCIIYVKIFEKILSGGLEVSFTIHTLRVYKKYMLCLMYDCFFCSYMKNIASYSV